MDSAHADGTPRRTWRTWPRCHRHHQPRQRQQRSKATIEFDNDEDSETVRSKVASGTLKGVSVGYRVFNYESVKEGAKSLDGRFTGPCYIAKKWQPYEISIVSVPADTTGGVGRDMTEDGQPPAVQTAPGLAFYESQLAANRNY